MSKIKSFLNKVIHEAFLLGYNNARRSGSWYGKGDHIPVASKDSLLAEINRVNLPDLEKNIHLTMVYDCDLSQMLENIKEALPGLSFIHPEINMTHTEWGWRVEIQEDKKQLAELRRLSA